MDTTIKKQGRIKSLEGLRALAFLGVIYCHTGLGKGVFTGSGAWGVSLFFILSGFVAVYSQFHKSDYKPSIAYNFKYFIQRIKKLYPLYVLTALAYVPFEFIGNDKTPLLNVLIRLGLNLTFLQEYLPFQNRSYCGPAWFMCTLALFYFIFPWILKRIQSSFTKKKAIVFIIVCILFECLFYVGSLFLPHPIYEKNMLFAYDITHWFVYYFPLSRIFDCLIGCCLGYLFIVNESKTIKFVSIKEMLSLLICLITIFAYSMIRPVTPAGSEIPVISYTLEWTSCLMFLPGTMSIIYLFAYCQGKLSHICENKFFMYLAKLSPYGFLIHYVIFNYMDKPFYYILGQDAAAVFISQYGGWIKLTLGFLLTLIATQIWIWFMGLFSKPKKRISNVEPSK